MSNYESVARALAEGADPGWRKSSRSSYNGNCVEVGEDWRKSSLSVNGGNCVEAGTGPGAILVRDTADRSGPVIAFPVHAWTSFAAGIAAGRWTP